MDLLFSLFCVCLCAFLLILLFFCCLCLVWFVSCLPFVELTPKMAYVSGRRRRRLFSSSSYRLQKVSIGISVTNSPCSKLESGVLWCKFFQAQRVCVGLAEKTLPADTMWFLRAHNNIWKRKNDYLRFNGRPIPSTRRLVSHWCCTHNPTGEECVNRWTCGYNPGGNPAVCVSGFLFDMMNPEMFWRQHNTFGLFYLFFFLFIYSLYRREFWPAVCGPCVLIEKKKKVRQWVCVVGGPAAMTSLPVWSHWPLAHHGVNRISLAIRLTFPKLRWSNSLR